MKELIEDSYDTINSGMIINNNFAEKEDAYPLRLIKHELIKHRFDFVIHCGVRNLLYNGDFFGITTTRSWNDKVRTPLIINQSKEHYRREIASYLNDGIRYVLRNKDLVNNSFLHSLAEQEVCNGLGIYTKNSIGVLGYFFTAKHNDKEATHFFVNHLTLFSKIVDQVDKQLLQENYWNKAAIIPMDKGLFDFYDRRVIFRNIKINGRGYCGLLPNNRCVEFTSRQLQILDLLKFHSNTKDIAFSLNLTVRTIEWHLSEIRKKVGANNRVELLDFIQRFSNQNR